jgi:hypothetical protein
LPSIRGGETGQGQAMTDDQPADDRRPTDNRPPVQFRSRLPPGDRSPLIPILGLTLLVAIAVLGARSAAPEAADGGRPTTPRPVAAAAEPGSPAPSSGSAADAAVASICLEPGSWRTATVETWRSQTVHVWRAIDPAPASGPNDPSIPIVPAVGTRVEAIGFCAPVVGEKRPVGPATVDAWRLDPAGATEGPAPSPVPLELRRLVPVDTPSPLGGLFGPPGLAEALGGWSPGVIVFRYAPAAGGPANPAIWFGIEVVRTDASGKEASPAPSPLPRRSP